jgi:hypothetical protein
VGSNQIQENTLIDITDQKTISRFYLLLHGYCALPRSFIN